MDVVTAIVGAEIKIMLSMLLPKPLSMFIFLQSYKESFGYGNPLLYLYEFGQYDHHFVKIS